MRSSNENNSYVLLLWWVPSWSRQGGNEPLFGWACAGGPLTLMAGEAVGYVALTLLLETKAVRYAAEQLDQLRVAPFLARLGRRGHGTFPVVSSSPDF